MDVILDKSIWFTKEKAHMKIQIPGDKNNEGRGINDGKIDIIIFKGFNS